MTDIVDRLKNKAARLIADQPNDQEIAMLLTAATIEIERLRMAQTGGPSFRELKHDIITTEFKHGSSV